MDRETAERLGLPYDPILDDTQEAISSTAQAPLSSIGAGDSASLQKIRERVLRTLDESDVESRGYQDTLNRIEEAKQRLLAAPDKRQMLQGLVGKLTATRSPDDPRFFERQNLYTFMRDVGEYGQEQKAAEREREAKRIMLQEMQAKYGMEMAEKRRSRAELLAAQYLSKEPKETETPANLRETQYYQNVVKNPTKFSPDEVQYAQDWLKKSVRIPPEKGESDPDKPPTTVINRVSGVVSRDLSPVAARLGALNETRAAIANARTNPAQVPQVDRFFARLTGDSQLSQLEVNAVANSGAFPSRVANQISKFLTGSPTDLSLDQKAEVLDVLEDVLAPSFNSKRNQILNQFSVASDISPEAVEKIVGPRYLTAKEKRRLAEEKKAREEAEARADSVSTSTGKQGRLVN
jgi:hypothetical protein